MQKLRRTKTSLRYVATWSLDLSCQVLPMVSELRVH